MSDSSESGDDDFVPGSEEDVSLDDSQHSGDGEPPLKRQKTTHEPEVSKQQIDDVWAMFQGGSSRQAPAEVSSTPSLTLPASTSTDTSVRETPSSNNLEQSSKSIDPFASVIGQKPSIPATPQAVHPSTGNSEASSSASVTETKAPGSQPTQGKKSNLSSLLSNIKGGKKITTIEKSKLDWEKFRQTSKLEEDLKAQVKNDSYLEKQAFLQRADFRQFEQEKSVRDKERAQRNKK